MKKIILITSLTLLSFVMANGQKVEISFVAGLNMQNINGKDMSGNKLTNKLLPKFFAGMYAAFPLAKDFYLQPGLIYTTKGAKTMKGDEKVNLGYIEIPINFLYKPVLGSGHLLFGFGPYVGRGIHGTADANNIKRTVEFENSIAAGDLLNVTKAYYRPFDIGANIFVGFEASNGISMRLNSQLGLIDINPKIINVTNDQSSLKNTGFGVSVAYRIN